MKLLITALKRFWPLLILLAIEILIIAANYTPNTFLMGWDNVMPEFNFALNFKRQLMSIWQGYRGLGHSDGMAHAANLVHTLFLWLLSIALPQNMLRYSFHFLMHFLGAAGMYLLLNHLFFERNEKFSLRSNNKLIPLLGAVFYQLNFITVQMFYAPLEGFSVHYAALPWVAVSLLSYLQSGTKKRFFFFVLVLLLATPQYFVATLIVPVFFLMLAIASSSLLFHRHQEEQHDSRMTLKRILTAIVTFFLINAFWLLPYVVGVFQNAPIIASAKINEMSSQEIFLRNKSFGDLKNVLFLRGFSLDYVDLGPENTSELMMDTWRNHLYNAGVTFLTFIVAVITLYGLYRVLTKKRTSMSHGKTEQLLLPFTAMFGLGLLLLGNNTPLISELNAFLRETIPFFGEAFRFPFTKFSLLFAFSYTIFFVYGVSLLAEKSRDIHKHSTLVPIIASFVCIFCLAYPIFKGEFLYAQLKVKLPGEYQQLFSYLKTQPENEKIALLPAFDYWNWKYYRWGYRGSGFLWHGVPQATLDRAFDPWSRTNETFYWELSHALYSKDWEQFTSVLKKYQVNYVLYDGYAMSSSHNRALFTEEIQELLNTSNFQKQMHYGDLQLFKISDETSLIETASGLPRVYPAPTSQNDDRVYTQLDAYVSLPRYEDPDIVYPFGSLATTRNVNERDFQLYEDKDVFIFKSRFVNDKNGFPIQSGVYNLKDHLVYDTNISKSLITTQVRNCDTYATGQADATNMVLGDKTWLRLTAENHRNCLSFGTGELNHTEGYLVAVESRNISGRPMKFGIISRTAKHVEIEAELPKNKNWTMSYFILPPLAADGIGYDIYLTNYAIAETATNDISGVRIYRFPYDELLNFHIPVSSEIPHGQLTAASYLDNGLFYTVTVPTTDTFVVFNQSYHSGWTAFTTQKSFPFIKTIDTHVLINNWANGWELPNQSRHTTVYIFFLPQLLQWLGFILLVFPLGMVTWQFVHVLRRRTQ